MGKFSGIIVEVESEQERHRARTAALSAPEVSPDDMGRALQVAERKDLPPGVVADNLREYEQEDQLAAAENAAGQSPALARWLGDPVQTAVAKDDLDVLGEIGKTMRRGMLYGQLAVPGMALPAAVAAVEEQERRREAAEAGGPTARAPAQPGWFSEMVGRFESGWYAGKAGIATLLPEGPAVIDPVTGQLTTNRTAETGALIGSLQRQGAGALRESAATDVGFEEIAAAEATGDTGKIAGAIVTNPRAVMMVVAESLGATAPNLALSAAMPASRAMAAVTAGGGSFTAEQGFTVLDVMAESGIDTTDASAVSGFMRDKEALAAARSRAVRRGVAVGAFDALTAGFAGRLLSNSRRSIASVTGRVAGEGLVQAAGGAAGEAGAQLATEGRITSQSDVLLEAAAEVPTFLAEGRGQLAQARRAAINNADRFDAVGEQRSVTRLVQLASQSKTRARAAGRFESLVQSMTAEGEDTIYLPADAAQRLFQSAADGGADLSPLVDQVAMREAIATGGELAIPLSKYASIVTPEQHALVADAVRLQAGTRHDLPTVSPEEIQEAIEAGLTEARTNDERENGPAGQVFDDVYGQLLSRQDDRLARQNAAVVQSVYRNLAERSGMDAWSLYQQFRINIPGAKRDVRGARRGVDIDIDPLLDALRTGQLPTDADIYGETLVSALHRAGGLRESGGELANMDAAKARPGLVNNLAGMTLDDALVWAHEEGFIAEAPTQFREAFEGDAPDINTLLDMVGRDLSGTPVYRANAMNAERAKFRESAESLRAEIDQRGIDLGAMDNAAARAALGPTFNQPAYHGTPHTVDRFSLQKIGTGEGNQVYGWGLYFASQREIAEHYRDNVKDMGAVQRVNARLSELANIMANDDIAGVYRKYRTDAGREAAAEYDRLLSERAAVTNAKGNLYQVDVPEDSDLLDWDKPLSEQADIFDRLYDAARENQSDVGDDVVLDPGEDLSEITGHDLYEKLIFAYGESAQRASEYLMSRGIPGLRYLDGSSRSTAGGEILSVTQQDGKWRAKVRVLNRGGVGFTTPADIVTTSPAFDTEAEAQTWAEDKARTESHNYVIWDEAAISEPTPLDYAITDVVQGESSKPESAATRELVDQAIRDQDLGALLTGIAQQDGIDPEQAWLANKLAPMMDALQVRMVAPPSISVTAGGAYDLNTNEVWIVQATPSVVMHELLHGATSALMKSASAKANSTVQTSIREFDDLLAHVRSFAAETDIGSVDPRLRQVLNARAGPLSNIRELLAYGMTDKSFQTWLATIPPPVGREQSRNAWEAFKDTIARLLGIPDEHRSALDALIESTSDLVEFGAANPRAVRLAQTNEASRLSRNLLDFAEPEGGANDPSILMQGGDKPRGVVTFGRDRGGRVFNIELLAGMDASTFMHEMGHVYLEVLNDLAAREGAAPQVLEDVAALNEWLGREAGKAFTVEQHEQFARGWEAYLREGKAPSSALRRVFAAFKVWLTALYRSARSLNVELTDEVRGVMDRIVASDAEIAEARGEQYQEALIADGVAVGMSADDFAAYNRAVQDARAEAEAVVAAEVLRAMRREEQTWFNAEKRRVRAEVLAELRATPVYRTQRLLRTGKLPDGEVAPDELRMKLSKEDLLDRFGQSFLRNLSGMYSVEGGVRAEEAAQVLGFRSGAEMVDALVNAPPIAEAAAVETDARMSARYPDPMTDGTLPDRAMIAAHRERQADVMVREIRALERHVGGRPLAQSDIIKGVAKRVIADKKLRQLQPATYRAAEARAGREAFEAASRQDWPAALAARRRQLLNFELFREAVRARNEAQAAAKYLARFSQDKARARLGKLGGDYLDQVDALLDRFDFRKITDKAADRRASLAAWVSAQSDRGIELDLSEKLLDETFRMPFRELTMGDLRSVRDAVKQIDHLARLKGKLLLAGEIRDAAEIDEAMAASLREANAARLVTTGDESNGTKIRRAFMQGRVLQATATDLAREMEGFKAGGAVWSNTVGVVRDAINNRVNPKLKEAQEALAQVYVKHYTKADIRKFNDKVPMPEVNGDLWSKSRLLSLALNWGNEGNREAILTQARGRLSAEQASALLGRLDARDWAFVQDVWQLIDGYWPAIAEAQKRRTGLVPERVQPKPFTVTTSDGRALSIPGGYYPLKYESDSVKTMKEEADDFYNSIRTGRTAKASTRNGHTIERVGSGGRSVRLDTGVVQQHLRDVVRDVYLGDAINYVHNVLNGGDFKAAVDDTGLQEYRQALEVWLKDAAAGEIGPRVWHERAMRSARTNFTASVLTFKFVSAALQVTGLIQSSVVLGQADTWGAVAQFTAKPLAMTRYVRASSPYMDSRVRTHIEAVQQVMDAEAGRFAAGKAAMMRWGYWMMGRVQQIVDVATWMAAESQGMRLFDGDIARARLYADDAVSRAQGSGEFVDKSPLQRGTLGDNVRQTEWVKATTALMGYMIAKGNAAYEVTRKTSFKSPLQAMRWASQMIMLYSIEGLIVAAIRGGLPSDDDDDGILDDIGEFVAKDTTGTLLGTVPGAATVVDEFRGYDAGGVLANAWRAYARVVEQTKQGEMDAAAVKAVVTATGITLGLPSSQVNKTIDAIAADEAGRDVSPYQYLAGPKKETPR